MSRAAGLIFGVVALILVGFPIAWVVVPALGIAMQLVVVIPWTIGVGFVFGRAIGRAMAEDDHHAP